MKLKNSSKQETHGPTEVAKYKKHLLRSSIVVTDDLHFTTIKAVVEVKLFSHYHFISSLHFSALCLCSPNIFQVVCDTLSCSRNLGFVLHRSFCLRAFLFVLYFSSYQCLQKSTRLAFNKPQTYDIALNYSHLYLMPTPEGSSKLPTFVVAKDTSS